MWRRGLAPEPVLEPEALERAALGQVPASSLGDDPSWREPFALLVSDLQRSAALNPLGRAMAHGQIVMTLRARTRAQSLWKTVPEIRHREVAPPIIILGQMRSGTTRLHRLLACDSRFAHTRLSESLAPVPLPGPRWLDRRLFRAWLGLLLLHRLNPETRRIHPTSPRAPEEEFGLFSFSFGSAQFEAQWRLPNFVRYWEGSDAPSMAAEFKALLQTIGWRRNIPQHKTWLLKAPQFMQDLPLFLELFPGATLIRTRRAAEQVVASSASLVWNQMRVQSDEVDREWVGREWLRKTVLREQRSRAALDRAQAKVVETSFEAMSRDWRAEMKSIYDGLGLDLPAPVLTRMENYVRGSRAHRGHAYDLESFGLSQAAVDRAFCTLGDDAPGRDG